MKRAEVKLETGQARVTYDDAAQTAEKLAAAIDKLGFRASLVSVTDAASIGPSGATRSMAQPHRTESTTKTPS